MFNNNKKEDIRRMISPDTIKKTIFFDIETTTRYKTYEEYLEKEPYSAKDFENQIRMKKEYDSMSIPDAYQDRGMLSPEHGMVVSIGCRVWNEDIGDWDDEIFGFKSWKEFESQDRVHADRDILIGFNEVLFGLYDDAVCVLGGYAINSFDIPFLYRRMLSVGLYPQPTLNLSNKKSWNLYNLDLKSWWSESGANGFSGFSSASEMMGIGSSKEEGIDGRQVCHKFWDDNDVDAINRYCMRDVQKSAEFAIALSEPKVRKRHAETMADYHRRMAEKKTDASDNNNDD